jgi:hypothetical protein
MHPNYMRKSLAFYGFGRLHSYENLGAHKDLMFVPPPPRYFPPPSQSVVLLAKLENPS